MKTKPKTKVEPKIKKKTLKPKTKVEPKKKKVLKTKPEKEVLEPKEKKNVVPYKKNEKTSLANAKVRAEFLEQNREPSFCDVTPLLPDSLYEEDLRHAALIKNAKATNNDTKNKLFDPVAIRRRLSLAFRFRGYTYSAIADLFGVKARQSYSDVIYLLNQTFQNTTESNEQVLQLEAKRLDDLYKHAYAMVKQGVPRGVNDAVKVLERRAKMFGLDQPVKVQTQVTGLDIILGDPDVAEKNKKQPVKA